MFQTEFDFTLPCGYLDEHGTLHRDGVMRRATAADETCRCATRVWPTTKPIWRSSYCRAW
jgi:hypothetical protein